ncbi:MAG: Mur ligase family protein, partial [Planctomycetota bacterium]
MRLKELTSSLRTMRTIKYHDAPIRIVTDDSRNVKPGALFVAVDGEQVDGQGFIPEAMERGAAAVVCERLPLDTPKCPVIQVTDSRLALSALADAIHGHVAGKLCVVGVTGTDGKTTTTELVRAVLEEDGHPSGCLTTEQSDLGDRTCDSAQTTPHPLALHGLFREMTDAGLTHACMEVSSHALAHHRTAHVPFDTAILTNVTQDHLDFHGSRENYIRAKQKLFEQLSSDAVAVLNAECPVWWRYSNATRANVLTYGINSLADVRLLANRGTIKGTRLRIQTPLDTFTTFSPLVGDYNCENILAAVTAAFGMGIPAETIVRAIETFSGVGGRLEKIAGPAGSKRTPVAPVKAG